MKSEGYFSEKQEMWKMYYFYSNVYLYTHRPGQAIDKSYLIMQKFIKADNILSSKVTQSCYKP